MVQRMAGASAPLAVFVAALLLAPACATIPTTDDGSLVPVISFQPGHQFAGSFFATEDVARNTPTVVGILALPNQTQLFSPTVALECAAIPPPGELLPRKFILSLSITDSTGAELVSDKARLKIRPDGNCKSKTFELDVLQYPPGSMVELTLEAKGRPLVESTHVAYEVTVT
jgi:hypothetical protein